MVAINFSIYYTVFMNETSNPPDQKGIEHLEKKTAVVAIIGRPSSGKSTFLNTVCREQVSIVSSFPQTTRNAIRGIVNTSEGQIVFIDTPGYHESDKKLNLKLQSVTRDQFESSDCLLYILDSTRDIGEEEETIAGMIKPYSGKTVIAINKTDLPNAVPEKDKLFLLKTFPDILPDRIFQISAKKNKGLNDILKALYRIAPVAPELYPEEFYTDQEVGFRISEIIRGQAINRLEQELPHSVYVNIADMEMKKEGKLLWVRAFLCVERESQKGIVIGKNASMIKTIRIESIKAMRKIFPYSVDLDLQVKVDKNWRQKDSVLARLIP
jgi:GTPase